MYKIPGRTTSIYSMHEASNSAMLNLRPFDFWRPFELVNWPFGLLVKIGI